MGYLTYPPQGDAMAKITGADQVFTDARGAGRNPNAPDARRSRGSGDAGRKGGGGGKWGKTAGDVTDARIDAAIAAGKNPNRVFAQDIAKMAPVQAKKARARIKARVTKSKQGRRKGGKNEGMFSDSKGY